MTTINKFLIGAIAAAIAAVALAEITSHLRIAELERAASQARAAAETHAAKAEEMEKQTYVYEEKIRTLEGRLEELQGESRRQSSLLDKLAADTDAARRALHSHRSGAK